MPSSKINYLEIIQRSWNLTWNHRRLWWLGLLFSIGEAGTSLKYSLQAQEQESHEIKNFFTFLGNHPLLLSIFIIVFIVIIIGLFSLKVLSRGAIVRSIQRTSPTSTPTVREGLREGKKYFWKVFLIEFFIGAFVISAILIIFLPIIFLFYHNDYLIGALLSFLALLIIIPLIFLASFLKIYGLLYVLLGELAIWSALERAYFLLKNNLWSSIIMTLVIFLLEMALGLITLAAFLPFIVILIFLALILIASLQKIGVILSITIGIAGLIILAILIKSVYAIFAQSVWIFFFQEIAKYKEEELSAPFAEKELGIKPTSITDTV